MKKSPTVLFFAICGFLFVLLLVAPHLLPITRITFLEQCSGLSAATISIVITACVTGLLLQCQSNTDERREKNAKVYEQKLNVCLDFFKELCNIVENGKITAEEANHLKFTFSYVAIHLSEESMVTISEKLSTIAQNCGQPASLQGKKPLNLAEELLTIAHTIRREIYPQEAREQQKVGQIVANLNKLDEQVENKLKLQEINCEYVGKDYIRLLKELVEEIKKLDSSCDADWGAPGPSIRIKREYAHCIASISMGIDKPGRYYFQCQVKTHGSEGKAQKMYAYLHKCLGGRVGNDSGWWCEVPREKAPVEDALASTEAYEAIKQYFVSTLLDIIKKLQIISEYNELQDELKVCELEKNWNWLPLQGKQAVLSCRKGKVSCMFTIVDKETFSNLTLIRESSYDIAWKGKYKDKIGDEVTLVEKEFNKDTLVEKLSHLDSHFQILDKIQEAINMGRELIIKKSIANWLSRGGRAS